MARKKEKLPRLTPLRKPNGGNLSWGFQDGIRDVAHRLLAGEKITMALVEQDYGKSPATAAVWIRAAKQVAGEQTNGEKFGQSPQEAFKKMVTRSVLHHQRLQTLLDVFIQKGSTEEAVKLHKGLLDSMKILKELTSKTAGSGKDEPATEGVTL